MSPMLGLVDSPFVELADPDAQVKILVYKSDQDDIARSWVSYDDAGTYLYQLSHVIQSAQQY